MNTGSKPRILIVGGGFGGIETALGLKDVADQYQVTLLSDKTYFEYYPALYKVVTGALPTEVSIPLWMIFDQTAITVEHDRAVTFIPEEKRVIGESGSHYEYDYLVLAIGSQTNYFSIPGLAEHSLSFKSVHEALRLKNHFYRLFTQGNGVKEELVSLLHIVIVGAGPSGVELAGDLKEYLQTLAEKHHVDPSLVTIDLIESNPRVLPSLPESVSRMAEARLRKLGINIFTNRTLMQKDIEEVHLRDMQMKTETVIWTAGTKINEQFAKIPALAFSARKRVVVDEYLRVPELSNFFIVGDGAETPYSGLAQTAIHNGKYVAQAIKKVITGKTLTPYNPHKGAYIIPIGSRWAILAMNRFRAYGFLPWVLRTLVDVRYYAHILPFRRLWYVLREGKKYGGIAGGCKNEEECLPPEPPKHHEK
ncbi:MAG TPA: NAD(P)/FAD-dependent oxidoreductase [Candidatus Paceibacterota bacterium]|nr:NAD(P)/FAD-dependent oxidoreductase [Candidatus Paceibacterota bacterium]